MDYLIVILTFPGVLAFYWIIILYLEVKNLKDELNYIVLRLRDEINLACRNLDYDDEEEDHDGN